MIFNAIAYLLLATLAVVALGVLLVPVYLWLLHRDAMLAPQRATELGDIEALLAETDTLLAKTCTSAAARQIPNA